MPNEVDRCIVWNINHNRGYVDKNFWPTRLQQFLQHPSCIKYLLGISQDEVIEIKILFNLHFHCPLMSSKICINSTNKENKGYKNRNKTKEESELETKQNGEIQTKSY